MVKELMEVDQVLDFWFQEIDPSYWWKKDLEFDALIGERFRVMHHCGAMCELYAWRSTARGRLAEIILLDQFSRNLYRSDARAFASDSLALCLAQEAIKLGVGTKLTATERSFLYMPFMHSESQKIHEIAVDLFGKNGNQNNYEFELKHKAIIDRFGRYPHRNKILGRTSTEEELLFLLEPDSHF